MKGRTLTAFLILAAALAPALTAQPIPSGDLRVDQYRLQQLLSDSLLPGSLANRPLWMHTYRGAFDSAAASRSWWERPLETPRHTFDGQVLGPVTVGLYEPVLTNSYNSELPYGENNGAAWYGRGHTSEVQGGFYVTSDYLTVTFRPHLVHAQNGDFTPPNFIPLYPDSTIRYVAPGYVAEDTMAERIDRPFRFGPDAYGTQDLGLTSVRAHYGSFEAGLTNETLWWGPALKYPLMLSNNAPGLNHVFIGTRSPVDLPLNIGQLEFRWMWARPRDSGYFDLNLEAAPNEITRAKREKLLTTGRYMNGLNLAFSPEAVPGLTVGLSRAVHGYMPSDSLLAFSDSEPLGWKDFTRVFRPFPKPPADSLVGTRDEKDEGNFMDVNPMASVWFRWVFPGAGAEIYGEFFKQNHNFTVRDLITQPQHGRAYTFGGQKVFRTAGLLHFLDLVRFQAEFNSLIPGQLDDVRPQTYYYTHKSVKQGHTNEGQVLGAAIGPGSSSQYLGMDAFFKRGMAGIFVQRMAENDHFHYEFYDRAYPDGDYLDQYRHQIHLNIGLKGKVRVGPVLAEGELIWNRQYNYGREGYGDIVVEWETRPRDDVLNLFWQLRLRYLF